MVPFCFFLSLYLFKHLKLCFMKKNLQQLNTYDLHPGVAQTRLVFQKNKKLSVFFHFSALILQNVYCFKKTKYFSMENTAEGNK